MSPLGSQVYIKKSFRYAFHSVDRDGFVLFIYKVRYSITYYVISQMLLSKITVKKPVEALILWKVPVNRSLICYKDGKISSLFRGQNLSGFRCFLPVLMVRGQS